MQSYIFMWCRRFQEGSNLNIEIHEYSQRPKIFRSKNISQDNLLCKVSVKYNNLWEHLVSEVQQCWDAYRVRQGHHWGNKLLLGMCMHHLTSKQLNSAAQTVVNCIDVIYKVGHFFALSKQYN